MFKKFLLTSLILLLTVPVLTSTNYISTVQSDNGSRWNGVYYNSYNVTLNINMDASFTITEVMETNFTKGVFVHGYRVIPYKAFEKLTDVIVAEVDENGEIVNYTKGSYVPQTYSIKVSSSEIIIEWWFYEVDAEYKPIVKTFIVKYKAVGALDKELFKKRNYINWYVLPLQHPIIKTAHLTVKIPSPFDQNDLELNPSPDEINTTNEMTLLTYHLENVDEETSLRIYVNFPLIISPPFYLRKTLRDYNWLIAIVIILSSIVLSLSLYKKVGKKESFPVTEQCVKNPKIVDPSETFILERMRFEPYLSIVTVFQLACKDLVKLEFKEGKILIRVNKERQQINKLSTWETTIFSYIKDEGSVKLSYISSKKMKSVGKKAFKEIESSLLEKGLIKDYFNKLKFKALTLSFILLTPSVIAFLAFTLLNLIEFGYVFILAFSISIFTIMSRFLDIISRTKKGEKILVETKSYVNHLRNLVSKGLPKMESSNDFLDRLEFVFSKEFAWIVAFSEPSDILDLFNITKKVIKGNWKNEKELIHWSPSWLNITILSMDIGKSIETIIGTVGEVLPAIEDVMKSMEMIFIEIYNIFKESFEVDIGGSPFDVDAGDFDEAGGGGIAGFD